MLQLSPGTRPPWVIAHRGASASCPENTFAAFDRALEEGCDAMELDLQLSRDGVPMVFHDRDLLRICGIAEPLSILDAEQLRAQDVGGWFAPQFAGQRMPTLAEVLARYADRARLFLELKEGGSALVEAVADALRGALGSDPSCRDRLGFLCFEPELLGEARCAVPGVFCGLNLRAPAEGPFDALSVDIRRLEASFVEEVHASGRPVLSFTCNTDAQADRALAAGVDALFSDRPGWLSSYRERSAPTR